ncbi:MAG: hypothetical protein IJF17_05250 [Thermoguttaceae bacterium]|nr:hypothetical protein [Thermoguttaceae bacterium]
MGQNKKETEEKIRVSAGDSGSSGSNAQRMADGGQRMAGGGWRIAGGG